MRGPSIRDVAAPFLHQLAAIFTETVTLSVRSGMRRVPIDQILSTREVFMRVELGRSWPLYAGGSGRAILAAMDRRAQLRYLDTESLTPLTAGTVVNPQQLLAVLATDRERGYSTSCGERDSDAFSVAAAFTVDGRVAGSIAVCGPAGRYNEELAARIGSQVTEKARLLSESLSGVADE
jgi:DNA-binding IclR family transcriptional regulator